MTEELNPAPLPNGAAPDLGPVPVMGAAPIVAKPKRKRRKKAAPKVARTPKVKPVDPLKAEHEASKASATTPPLVQSATPIEDTPAPSIVQGAGAVFAEARESRHRNMFADARSTTAPPINSTWRQRFVFGLRRMTGFDKPAGEPEPVRLSTTLTAFLLLAAAGASAGVYMAWF